MSDSILLVWQYNSKVEPVIENGNTYPETKTISSENGSQVGTQDKDVVVEGFASVGVYDQWVAPPVSGQRPKARYEVLALAIYNNYKINSATLFFFLIFILLVPPPKPSVFICSAWSCSRAR